MGLNHAGRGRCESGHAMFCSLRAVCIVLTLGVVASTVVSHVHATDSEDDDLVFEDMDWLSSSLRAIRDVAAGSKNNKRAARQAKPTGKATVNSNLAQFEDYEGSGSEGSGDQELPKYYRCNLTIEQKYEPALSDPASSKSQLLAEALRNDIDNLYSEVDGTQSCNIISFSKTSDPNKVLVELDLGTRGNYDKNALYRTLEKEVQSGQIGAYEVYPEDFGCRDVDGNQFSPVYQLTCNPVEKACKDGSGCYIAEDECNGILDCDDGSDEKNCPTTTTTTTTEAPVITFPTFAPGPDKCRGDTKFTCKDGTRICEVQRCDGEINCPLGDDEDGCPSNAPEFTTTTTTEAQSEFTCEADEFQCDGSNCIPESKWCDGNRDCIDGTDERNCPAPECESDKFQCDTDLCISRSQVCDGNEDCFDGTDELECPEPECGSNQFQCDTNRCISLNQLCDRNADCLDGTDERNCPAPTCQSGEFLCDSDRCIPESSKCDQRADCDDRTDEFDCPPPDETLCQLDEHKCDSGLCISVSKRCDGNYDCPDRSDERGCPCRQDEWQCDNAKCIDRRLRCDGKADCPNDNSDERECPNTCLLGQFSCRSGGGRECIPSWQRCDGVVDCRDSSDEAECEDRSCGTQQFDCGNGLCMPDYVRCNGFEDCPTGVDELQCPCDPPKHQCGLLCLEPSAVCDGRRDCVDGSDESNCPVCDARREFTCGDGSCVDIRRKCDGYSDCRDRSDEADCPCRGDQFRCGGGQCIDGVRRCDRNYDCPDRSDEQGCPQPPILCPLGQFKCANDEKCILKNLVCDNKYDCSDGSDEANCASPPEGLQLKTYPDEQTIKQGREVVFQCRDEGPIRTPVRWVRGSGLSLPPGSRTTNGRLEMPNIQPEHGGTYVCEAVGYPPSTPGSRVSVYLRVEPFVEPTTRPPSACGLDEATCMNGECVSKADICNGRFDCSDGSDEMRCGNYSGCEPNEYQCDNRRCILKTWRCDGDDDCGDNSDEKYCEPSPPDSPCRHDEFQCHSQNQCIPKSFHCDMQIDCQDRSDEIGCSSPSIVEPPPPMIMVIEGETWSINCTAVGIPTPEIVWRLNWGHIPPKCTTTSVNGVGVLTCPDARDVDQGAYSCEAINGKVSTFAIPDTILVVKKGESPVCQAGEFNSQAASRAECLNCFCFGITTECSSSRLCITQLPPPRDQYQIIAIPAEATQGRVSVRSRETILAQSYLRSTSSGNGFQVFARDRSQLGASPDQLVYFNLPRSHRGNQLKSYGGYLRYNLEFRGTGRQNSNADVILSGNGMTLLHFGRPVPSANTNNAMTVRFWQGEWYKRVSGRPGGDIPIQAEELASREEIMLALQNIDHLLIKASYLDGPSLDTSVLNVRMDTAIEASSCPQGQAVLVEECRCPQGYTGISCDECAPGYSRVTSGPWLGRCERAPVVCPDGQYGDPGRGIPCQPCPCPSTSSGRSCFLDTDGQVTCNCPACYTGRRCERCDTANGCTGNALDGTGCSRRPSCDPETSFTCADSSCIPRCNVCDGRVHCPDGSDEVFCRGPNPVCDRRYTMHCGDGSCVSICKRCDGINDCRDGRDEQYCEGPTIPPTIAPTISTTEPACTGFACDNGRCIPRCKRCNGKQDCYDGSDEIACPDCNPLTQFTCSPGICVSKQRVCDGRVDCYNGLDEQSCGEKCNEDYEFRCADGTCIDRRLLCDGRTDCADRSDETRCPSKCDESYEFQCYDGSCLDKRRVCDRRSDCPDGSDEANCPSVCGTYEFQCSDGTCIDARLTCDRRNDCPDGSDENRCRPDCDASNEFTCGDGSCIDRRLVCNRRRDCADGSDETYCPPACDENTEFQCGDGSCIDRRLRCNRRYDCADGSDEARCTPACDVNYEFQCGDRSCIDRRLVCNRQRDCTDGSDEDRCPSDCDAETEFQCWDGTCMHENKRCDGRRDCPDGSDEVDCPVVVCDPLTQFICDGRCMDVRRRCDGWFDCTDRSDETNCPPRPDICNSEGTETSANGVCTCKEFVTGPRCDQCKPNSFYLNNISPSGCVNCFCMGITQQCSSSNWYRQQERAVFTTDNLGFAISDANFRENVTDRLQLNSGARELVYRDFGRQGSDVYYWRLPARFLGDKVSSYGGFLNYTVRYVPAPSGQTSRNNAPDVEIRGNAIRLWYHRQEPVEPNRPVDVSVPFWEQNWQRQDGQLANREHLLMALADLDYILIKATYTTRTAEAALLEVTLDYAEDRNTGQSRALAVEHCACPRGYRGLSCEDCDVGYTRSADGLYLGLCEPCSCNGHSDECDPETGVCLNCRDHTTGDNCERCESGYEGDATQGTSSDCRSRTPGCRCDPRGSQSADCPDGRQCLCKANVEGENCDRCRESTFGLMAQNSQGCLSCYCSGVSQACSSANLYRTQIPMQIVDASHGFRLTDSYRSNVISTGLTVDAAQNVITYSPPGSRSSTTLYWSLPSLFTGNKVTSYGGRLSVTQSYQADGRGQPLTDKDVLLIGNGVTLFFVNPNAIQSSQTVTYTVPLRESGWRRLDGPGSVGAPASRNDMMLVLSNLEAILIRATYSSSMSSTSLSNVIMDTAIPQYTGQEQPRDVEQCRCPTGYRGYSCEDCERGYYRDRSDRSNPAGICRRCPCGGNEESCYQAADLRSVTCVCLPGFSGRACSPSESENSEVIVPEKPTITVTVTTSRIQVVDAGSTARFQCSARSLIGRQVSIRWTKEIGELPRGRFTQDPSVGLLVITSVNSGDAGVYVCSAFDGLNTVTETAVLNVKEETSPRAPQVTVEPRFVDVSLGQTVDVRCVAEGNPQPTINWLTPQGNPVESQFVSGSQLRILSARKNDEGEYICSASNSVGTNTARVAVFVRSTPAPTPGETVTVTITPQESVLRKGEALRLSCQADGRAAGYSSRDPVTIRWTRVEGPLPSNAIQSGTSLVINSVSASDSGIYVCTAAYASGGSFQSQARVTVLAHRGPPTIRIEPDRQTISQGTNAELRCLATGDPNPTIRWTRFGENFGSNVYVSGPVLRITNALVEDRGMYICTAENPGGTAQASAIIEVERREPPAVELYPQARQTVVRGASALFQCRYTAGIPTPVVTWARTDGRPMSPNIEILDSGVIRFNRVTGSERGQYLCTASNDVGITTATAYLEIQSAPEVKLSPSGSIRVKMGSRQRLECRAEGEPAPTVSWKRLRTGFLYDALASPVSETPQVAVYEITRVTRADEGTYSCTARNAAGDTEERVQLIVEEDDSDNEISNGGNNQGPTGTVTSDIFTVPLGGTAEMRCYVYGSSQDLYLEWNRSDGGKMPLNKRIKDGVIYIDDVQREAAGDYECVGVNSVSGQIVFRVSTRLEVVVPPRITLNPARQTVRPGDYVLITCSATGDQPITIEWSKLGQALPPSVVVNSGQLQFRSIAVSDAGRYSCVAKNSVGQAEAVAEVIVNDTPVTSGNQREVTVEAGATAELRCYAPTSSVSPRVHWSRDRGQLQNNALPQANVLRLVNVQVSDSGRYICVVAAADGTRTSDYVLLRVQRTSQVSLKIRSNADEIHLGESVELVCEVSGASNAFVTWKKLASASLPRGVQVLDNVLRIPSVGSEHGGVYQCQVRVGSSTYEQEYAISIQTVTESASSPVETRTASFGTTVVMDCRTDLRGQVTFRWSKQGGVIRRDAVIRGNTLNLTDVRAEDAGTYVCTAQSSAGKVDIPVMLVVTGVVPYFAQAPVSFMSLPTLPDAYFQFEIEVSFKPESSDGLVLYNGQQSDGRGDFVSFGLNNGYPEFRFDVGAGPAVIRGDKPLELGKWHTVKLSRNRKDGTMTVDDEGPFYGSVAANQFQGLDLSEPMYIGGVPNIRNIHRLAGFNRGFVGCISRLVVGSVSHELMKDAQTSKGVTSCETCAVNPCENGGVCQEAHTEQGYACLCPAGFSGDRCQKVGDACYPGACEMGRCVNSAQGFECYCPFGKTGSRCEQDIDIQEPAFRDGSYVAYPTPKALNKLKMSMRFKPKETKDGILAYCAQKEDGAGDFASLAIKDRKVEFRFDTGSGPAILRSTREIQAGEWVSVAVDRNMQTGSLVLNQEPAVRGRSPGRTEGLNLNTKLYVGGWDKQRIRISPSVNVTAPFDGCVSYMEVAGMNFDLIDSIVDAANVDECAVERPCQRKPCLNGGLCEETGKGSMDYQCQCQHGFSGKSCELEADLCQVLQPCANGGTCVVIPNSYKCNCPLGFGGDDCEKKVDIGEEAYFEGDGYIEVDKSLMPHIGVVPETITIEFSTTEPNGVLLWHGQKPETNGKDKDYLALAVVNGHLVLHYDLGSGPAHISTSLRVDDGQRHKIVATRNGRDGSVQLDGIFIEHGSSGGNLFTLNTKGNIYIGGLPNAEVMTGGRYMQGFAGCIHSLKLQNSGVLNFQRAAILAINVSSCTSGSGMTQQRQEVVN